MYTNTAIGSTSARFQIRVIPRMIMRGIASIALPLWMFASCGVDASMVNHFGFRTVIDSTGVMAFERSPVSLTLWALDEDPDPARAAITREHAYGSSDGLGVMPTPAEGILGYGPLGGRSPSEERYSERLNFELDGAAEMAVESGIFTFFEPWGQVRVPRDTGDTMEVIGFDDKMQVADVPYMRPWLPGSADVSKLGSWLRSSSDPSLHAGERIGEVTFRVRGPGAVAAGIIVMMLLAGLLVFGWRRARLANRSRLPDRQF